MIEIIKPRARVKVKLSSQHQTFDKGLISFYCPDINDHLGTK